MTFHLVASGWVNRKEIGFLFGGPFPGGSSVSPEKDPAVSCQQPVSPLASIPGTKWGWKAYCLCELPGPPGLSWH